LWNEKTFNFNVIFYDLCFGNFLLKILLQHSIVAHIYNPIYLGGGGRRIASTRPIWAKSHRDAISRTK
jgi:hypothetical protein